MLLLTFVLHKWKNEEVEIENLQKRCRRQRWEGGGVGCEAGLSGWVSSPHPHFDPHTSDIWPAQIFCLCHQQHITKACWQMQLLWERIESPGHSSSISDMEEDLFSGSSVFIAETNNTGYYPCWLGHREFLSVVSMISLCQKQHYTWIWESTKSIKIYCAPCNLWAKEFRKGQKEVGEEVGGMVGGSEEKEKGMGIPLLPYFPYADLLLFFDFCNY